MGLQDREYYRDDDEPGFREWIGRRMTVVLIAITVGVFLVQLFSNSDRKAPGPVYDAFCLDTAKVQEGQIWRPVTASFVYRPEFFFGLLFGMVILYFFGLRKEEADGGWDLIAFYLLAGMVSQVGLFVVKLVGILDPIIQGFGAFGPVTAVLVWFGTRYARQPVNIFVATVPAWAAVAGVLALGVLLRFDREYAGEFLAYDLLGALFAFGYEKSGLRVGDWLERVSGFPNERRRRPARMRVLPREDESDFHLFEDDSTVGAGVAQAVEPRKNVDEQLEAKLDRVLEKVSRTGRESLTADERAVLQKASEVYKRRRGP